MNISKFRFTFYVLRFVLKIHLKEVWLFLRHSRVPYQALLKVENVLVRRLGLNLNKAVRI